MNYIKLRFDLDYIIHSRQDQIHGNEAFKDLLSRLERAWQLPTPLAVSRTYGSKIFEIGI